MRLCDDKHDEVCYETSDCPACIVRGEYEQEIEKYEEEIKKLTNN